MLKLLRVNIDTSTLTRMTGCGQDNIIIQLEAQKSSKNIPKQSRVIEPIQTGRLLGVTGCSTVTSLYKRAFHVLFIPQNIIPSLDIITEWHCMLVSVTLDVLPILIPNHIKILPLPFDQHHSLPPTSLCNTLSQSPPPFGLQA